MVRSFIIGWILALAPIVVSAQKAYETVSYSGDAGKKHVLFNLANGYIGASQVIIRSSPKIKAMIYTPDSGTPDKDGKLNFKTNKLTDGYFILNDMQEAYDKPPVFIYGVFISGGKSTGVKLKLNKADI